MNRTRYSGFSLLLLVGCANNPYAKTYQSSSEMVIRAAAHQREQPSQTAPKVVKGTDPNKDLAVLCSEGYAVIGQSKFKSSNPNEVDAIAQARAVGADWVLVYKRLASTEEETALSDKASAVERAATRFGPNGPAIIAGWTTTTTFGAESARDAPGNLRFEILALFLVKATTPLGARCTTASVLATPSFRLDGS